MIIGDWGNTQLRLWRFGRHDRPEPARLGQGVSQITEGRHLGHLKETLGDWIPDAHSDGILLCGAGGSNIGLFEVGYVTCPTGFSGLATACEQQEMGGVSVSILPGLACNNAFGRADRLRGEETQLLGAYRAGLLPPDGVICMPGTHPKWVLMQGGRVDGFTSTLTGEVFALMRTGSIIVPDRLAEMGNEDAFLQGAQMSLKNGPGALLSNLFALRGGQISGEFNTTDAADMLSGLLIGADVALAVGVYADKVEAQAITLIGGEALCRAYSLVLHSMGYKTQCHDGDKLVIAGLRAAAEALA